MTNIYINIIYDNLKKRLSFLSFFPFAMRPKKHVKSEGWHVLYAVEVTEGKKEKKIKT